MKYHLMTAALLVAAVLCYVAGFNSGLIVFAAVGLVLESGILVSPDQASARRSRVSSERLRR